MARDAFYLNLTIFATLALSLHVSKSKHDFRWVTAINAITRAHMFLLHFPVIEVGCLLRTPNNCFYIFLSQKPHRGLA